ncbi:hypothetical protein PAL_GLEAN10012644 [Pteropus alecto]|uniref:Uncharacterized protein n=1 Tax=Pteropus alecto TaxID=9402 RepID=L5K766_PTEAL|nr:hypothetical protein PAL_GLEAN10012644 [Pteropus alecto]
MAQKAEEPFEGGTRASLFGAGSGALPITPCPVSTLRPGLVSIQESAKDSFTFSRPPVIPTSGTRLQTG